jgi:hypothetical protein
MAERNLHHLTGHDPAFFCGSAASRTPTRSRRLSIIVRMSSSVSTATGRRWRSSSSAVLPSAWTSLNYGSTTAALYRPQGPPGSERVGRHIPPGSAGRPPRCRLLMRRVPGPRRTRTTRLFEQVQLEDRDDPVRRACTHPVRSSSRRYLRYYRLLRLTGSRHRHHATQESLERTSSLANLERTLNPGILTL